MSDAKNSPLPWSMHETGKNDVTTVHHISNANGSLIAEYVMPADAALIVRAVNAHSDLLAALESVMQWGNDSGKMFKFAAESDSGVMQAIHAAIAKAKGQP